MKSLSILALASSAAAGPLAQLLPLIGGPHSPILPAFPYPAIQAGCADYVDNVCRFLFPRSTPPNHR